MKSKSDKITKGIIFAGCSFTWGQGLYYYSNMSSLKQPKNYCDYNRENVDDTHIRFMESVRFPRLVANHFDTFEMVAPFNGGSNDVIIRWWSELFSNDKAYEQEYSANRINPYDISHLVFQCTQTFRNHFDIELNGKIDTIPLWQALDPSYEYVDVFSKMLDDKNLTIEEWQLNNEKNNIDIIKSFLQMVEGYGIKTILWTWPDDAAELIQKDEWLMKRFLKMNYNNKSYTCLQKMMDENSEMMIHTDYETFIETPIDHHPSLKCHKVIAENVIKHIENEN